MQPSHTNDSYFIMGRIWYIRFSAFLLKVYLSLRMMHRILAAVFAMLSMCVCVTGRCCWKLCPNVCGRQHIFIRELSKMS